MQWAAERGEKTVKGHKVRRRCLTTKKERRKPNELQKPDEDKKKSLGGKSVLALRPQVATGGRTKIKR